MTRNKFLEMIVCNEPCFEYRGKEYSICHPDRTYYVTAEDNPDDINLSFSSPEDLLDRWVIQGKTLNEILPDIDI